jgi:hypothetical protein
MPGFGSNAQVSINKQNSFGTAATSWFKVPFASEDFNFTYGELTDDSIQGRFDEPDRVTGIAGVQGNITANFDPLVSGHFIRACFGLNYSCTSGTGPVYTWKFNPATANFDAANCTLPPYSFQIDQGESNVSSSFLLQDCFVNNWELSLAAGAYLRNTFSIVGVSAALIVKSAAPNYAVTPRPLIWSAASISIGGAAVQRFQDFKLSFNNNIGTQDRIAGSKTHTYFWRDGFRQFGRFTATADMAQADWLAMKNETEQRLLINVLGAGASEYVTVDIPRFVYTAHPLGVSGPGMVTISLEGRAMYSTTSNTIATVTLSNTMAVSGYYGL